MNVNTILNHYTVQRFQVHFLVSNIEISGMVEISCYKSLIKTRVFLKLQCDAEIEIYEQIKIIF